MNRPAQSCRRRRASRGFTMVELLVASLAGLTVAMGAFAFAKASTRTFQQELRLSDATSGVTTGFRRLVADLERAGYLSSPNIQREYSVGNKVCLQPNTQFAPGIQSLSALRIERGPHPSTGTVPNTSTQSIPPSGSVVLAPDRLTLAGSYSSIELYPALGVEAPGGSNPVVYLDPLAGPALRTTNGDATVTPWGTPDGQQGVFRPGRILRIVDRQGFQHFGEIQAVTLAGPNPRIALKSTPGLFMRGSPAPGPAHPLCKGFETGVAVTANVINRIRYEIRDLRALPSYAELYPATPILPEDSSRLELVRYEIDASNNPIEGTHELVSEFAIDLKFGLTVATTMGSPSAPNPQLQAFDFDSDGIDKWAFEVGPAAPLPGPERIRSVRVRLSLRSREPDRATGLDPALMGAAPGTLFRYQIPGSTRFARVRTLQTEVAMTNQWWVFY